MKKLFCLFLVLIILISGCAKAPAQPVFNASPFESDKRVFVQGKAFNFYEINGAEYIKLNDLQYSLGAQCTTFIGTDEHSARAKINDKFYLLTTMDSVSDLEMTDIVGKRTQEEQTLLDSTEWEGVYTGCIYDGTYWFLKPEYVLPCFDNMSKLEDSENKTTYYTQFPKAQDVPEGYTIPIPMYHAVNDYPWSPLTSLFVTSENMEKHLKYIVENGYTAITFEDIANIDKIKKPVMLTFDDGYDDNYTVLLPLLKKYNVKVTIFLITDLLDTKHYLTREQVVEMNKSGLVSFQSHTVTHPFLGDCDGEKLDYEMSKSKLEVARLTGKEPFVLCYPTGDYSELSLEYTKKYYQFGLLMSGSTFVTGRNPVKITRDYIARKTTLDAFVSMIDK